VDSTLGPSDRNPGDDRRPRTGRGGLKPYERWALRGAALVFGGFGLLLVIPNPSPFHVLGYAVVALGLCCYPVSFWAAAHYGRQRPDQQR